MTNPSSAFALFRLLNAPGVGPVKARDALDLAEKRGTTLDELLDDPTSLQPVIREKQIDALRVEHDAMLAVWEKVNAHEVQALTLQDSRYPSLLADRLGRHAPPLIFYRGNAALFSATSLGFCGSRHASDKGLAVARACASVVATERVNVVSGYAAGVDLTTHRAALVEGGTTTIVLAEGILHFRVKRELKDVWDWSRVLVLSEYLPGVPWSVQNAMRRNSTISALCKAMVLIEARESGGSFQAGEISLKLGVPLFAPVYEGMPESAVGNRILLGKGARPFKKSRTANAPNLRPVMDALQASTTVVGQHDERSDAATPQRRLFGIARTAR